MCFALLKPSGEKLNLIGCKAAVTGEFEWTTFWRPRRHISALSNFYDLRGVLRDVIVGNKRKWWFATGVMAWRAIFSLATGAISRLNVTAADCSEAGAATEAKSAFSPATYYPVRRESSFSTRSLLAAVLMNNS